MSSLTARRQAANTSFDPAGTSLSATNVQGAIEEILQSGIAPAVVRATNVIRGGLNGIQSGVLDDIAADANRQAIQAQIDNAVTFGKIVEGDTSNGGEFQIAGGPITVPGSATAFTWRARPTFTFRQRSNNMPVLQLGVVGSGTTALMFDWDGCTLHYQNDQPVAENPNSAALVFGNAWLSRFANIRVCNTISSTRPADCVKVAQGAAFFSNKVSNLFCFQPYRYALNIANFGTENQWDNIYLSGVGPSGSAQSLSALLMWEVGSGQQTHGTVFNGVNFEWAITNNIMRINNARGVVFNSPHIEQCRLSGANAAVIRNTISQLLFNGGCILDIHILSSLVADNNPSIVRHFNNGRTQWNAFWWLSNQASYVNRPFYMHFQAGNEGFNTQPGKLLLFHPQWIDGGSSTSLRDNLRIDRTMGGVDMYGGDWGTMYTQAATEVHSGAGMTRVIEGDLRVDVNKTLYGSQIESARVTIPGTLSANIAITLSDRMGPPDSRWGNAIVPDGAIVTVLRGGTTVMNSEIKNHDGTTITTIGAGLESRQLNFQKVDGDWTLLSTSTG